MADKKNLPNPFPGLRPFQSDEEHLFFGRESQTLELLQLLRDNRFVGVIGTSGSGKSSLVRCGLLSELYGGSFLQAGTDWEVAVMNPGGGPFNQLSKSLVNADIYDSEEADIHLKLNATLRRSRLGLVEAIRQAKLQEGTNFLLVVDQFEEIFRYSEAGEEEGEAADDFISMILEAAKQSNIPIYVIITMRSDYIGDCSKFEGLPEEINDGEYLIPRLSREEYKSVIEGPVRVGGAKLAPRLLQRLLNDIGTESDQLPCLQHALMRTWDAWADRDGAEELDLEDYRAIGGMGKALSIHADEIFDTFDDKATNETATRMFRAITEKGDDNRGIRRPLRLQQLADITNHSIDEVKTVVDPYRQQGVTFLMPPSDRELEADTVIDISHESLMRVWQRLRNWVEEEAQSARIYRRLVDTSSLWKKKEAGLYHDPDLQIAQSWRDAYQPNEDWADLYGGGFDIATEFLEASEEEGRKVEREKELARQKELEQAQELVEARERSARNMKRFAAVVGVVAIIALAAMGFAVKAQKLAEKSQAEADEARKSAELAEENVRMEFARSDNSLGNSLSSSNTELALAHFSRSLEVEPNNPHAVDRSFNILAYQKPPKSQFADLDLKSNVFIASAANANGTLITTSVRGSNKNVSIWDPLKKNPLIEIPMSNGMNFWYGGLDLSKQGDLLAIGYNQGNDSRILKINEDGSYETETFLLRSHIGSVKFSGDGSRVLTNSWKHKVTEIWDIKTAEPTFSITSGSWYPTWSPDEKSILMGRHEAKVAAIIEIKSGNTKLFKHDEIIWHKAVYDQSGRKILTFGKPAPTETTQNFYVWDISTQQIQAILTHDNKEIAETIRRHNFENDDGTGLGLSYCVGCFSPDSQIVITAATDQNLKLWSAKNGQLLDSVKIPKLPARDQNPKFSDDGKRMMIPLRDGTCYILNFNNNYSELPPLSDSVSLSKAYNFIKHESKLRGITYPLPEVISAHLNEDCNLLLLGSKNGIAALFDTSSGEQVDSSFSHHGEIHEIATSLDGTKFATASNLGTIKVWELGTNKPIMEIGEVDHESKIRATKIHFSNDGDFLWIHTPNSSRKLNILTEEISNFEHTLTGTLAQESKDGTIFASIKNQLITVHNGEDIIFSANTGNPISSVALSNDSTLIATGLSDGSVQFWNIGSQTANLLQTGSGVSILSVSVSSDNKYIAAASSSGKLYIFNIKSNSNNDALIIEGDMACTNVRFNFSSSMIGAVFNDGSKGYAKVWNAETGASLTPKLTNGTPITNIEFTDEGNSILVWSNNKIYSENKGTSTKWDILISEEAGSTSHYTSLISQLGGLKLDENSTPVHNDEIIQTDELNALLGSNKRSDMFLRWQLSHPANRPDSPFRKNLSEEYLNKLTESNSIELLSEAIKINPENKIALLKRGILRLSKSTKIGDSPYALGSSDLLRAEKLISNNNIINCLLAMSYELLGKSELAGQMYNEISSSSKMNLDQLNTLIDLHESTNSPAKNTLILINKAFALSKTNNNQFLEKRYIVRKFILGCLDGNYSLATGLWKEIAGWPEIPEEYDPKSLLSSYIKTIESRAAELNDEGIKEEALKILTPAAIASLSQNPEQISSTVTKLFEISSEAGSSYEVVPSNSEWLYLDDGTDQGTEWKQPWFPAQGWSKGAAKLGYGGDGETTELSWGPNLNNKYRTYYFRHQFRLDKDKEFPFLLAKVVRDDGVVVYINGKEVIRDNMPDGKINYSTYSSLTANENLGNEIKEHQFQISGSYLDVGTNVIAAEVHQSNNSSSDLGFQLTLTGTNQTPISLISDSLVYDKTGELLKNAISLLPFGEREEKEILIKDLVTTYKLKLACESDDYAKARLLWKEICEWKEWPSGVKKAELANKFLDTTEKHAQKLYDQGEVEQATKLLLPAAFSTLVSDSTSIARSFVTLFNWAHPEVKTTILLTDEAVWKFLDDGSDQGSNWKDLDYDDQAWKEGPGKLGYGGDGETTQLSHGNDGDNKHITYYFRHKFKFEGDSIPKILTANLIRDDGAIVYLNGKEIIRSQMPKGEVNFKTLASGHAGGTNESVAVPYLLDSELIIKGENLIAAEIHQDNITSSDIGFSLNVEATDISIEEYIYESLTNEDLKEAFEESFNYLALSETDKAKTAFNYALSKDLDIENESTDIETLQMTLRILGKIKKLDNAERISKIKLVNSNKASSSESISEQKELLHLMAMNMKANGASEESLKSIRSMILKAPPRESNLSEKLLDLSEYYNASIYHYGGFHGGGEHQDLRFLPEKYDNKLKVQVPFDIRGAIRLNSGPIGNWSSANNHGGTRSIGQIYPPEVKGININAKAKKIHFLMGAVFSTNMQEGETAAILKINYEDETSSELPIIAKEDIFDWWTPASNRSPGLMEEVLSAEKIGWIGTDFNGNGRGLVKPIWINPYPEKNISTIDFISGLIDCCPFIVGITLE